MATQAPECSVLKRSRPRHSSGRSRRPISWLLVLIPGCASTPDGSLVDGSLVDSAGGSVAAGGSGGVISATGGSAVAGSAGLGTGGTGTGASGNGGTGGVGAAGGASNAGGAAPSGGTASTGGSADTGGATSSGGTESSGGAGGSGACSGRGEVEFVASFDSSVDDGFRAGLSACIAVAGALWSELLSVPFDATLEVLVSYDSSISTANGRSTTTVEWSAESDVYELSAAHEIRTGVDPNGATEDIQLNFGTALTNGTYWFDPDPSQRAADIPSGKIDLLSTCAHELGHALGFVAARSEASGELPGYSFLYDDHSMQSGGYYYFTGALAEAAYGAAVPQNTEVFGHLGNVSPAPGYDLDLDLMHGTPTRYRHRYSPTAVDAGILADLGLPVTGTPAAAAVCDASQARAQGVRASVGPKLGPPPPFIE